MLRTLTDSASRCISPDARHAGVASRRGCWVTVAVVLAVTTAAPGGTGGACADGGNTFGAMDTAVHECWANEPAHSHNWWFPAAAWRECQGESCSVQLTAEGYSFSASYPAQPTYPMSAKMICYVIAAYKCTSQCGEQTCEGGVKCCRGRYELQDDVVAGVSYENCPGTPI